MELPGGGGKPTAKVAAPSLPSPGSAGVSPASSSDKERAGRPRSQERVGSGITAQGRIDHGPPVAVIDIGSNSVRLVVYEGLARSLTPIFNEKVLAGLGREVLTTGLLSADAVDKTLAALTRFRALCDSTCLA